MLSATKRLIQSRLRSQNITSIVINASTVTPPPPIHEKPIGDISSVFPSLSGNTPPPLPQRFAELKQQIVAGHEAAVQASWDRLLPQLATEVNTIRQHGSSVLLSPFPVLTTLTNPDNPLHPVLRPPHPLPTDHCKHPAQRLRHNPQRPSPRPCPIPQILNTILHPLKPPTHPRLPPLLACRLRAILVPRPGRRPRASQYRVHPTLPAKLMALLRSYHAAGNTTPPHLRRPPPYPATGGRRVLPRPSCRWRLPRALGGPGVPSLLLSHLLGQLGDLQPV